MTEDRNTATAQRGRPAPISRCWSGSCRPPGRTATRGTPSTTASTRPCWPAWRGQSRLRRLAAIQVVTRSPIDIRPLVGVRKARNAKGLSLFSRALLARHRMTGSADDAAEARELLDWLIAHPAPGFDAACAGVTRTRGRTSGSSPRGTSPTGWSPRSSARPCSTGTRRCRTAATSTPPARRCGSCSRRRRRCIEDEDRWCVSYVPDPAIDWIVMDVSALTGALAARLGALTGDGDLIRQGGRLVRYVVSKQTDYGAWFYADPPSASHITHDNYHTGFILDAILRLRAGHRQRRVRGRLPPGDRVLRPQAVRAGRRGPVHERPPLPDRHPRVRPGGHHVLAAAAVPRRRRRDRRPGAAMDAGQHVGPGAAGGSTTSGAGDTGRGSGSCAGARAGCRGRSPATSRTAERQA